MRPLGGLNGCEGLRATAFFWENKKIMVSLKKTRNSFRKVVKKERTGDDRK
jgi:hypothetical protein